MLRRLLRLASWILLAGGIALLTALAWLRWEHGSPVALPAPTGRFAVGRTGVSWVDSTRADPLAPKAGTPREITAWVWYPAASNSQAARAEYLPRPWRDALSSWQGFLLAGFFARDPRMVQGNALADPPPAGGGPFPLVIFRPGMGAPASDYSTLACDLASHGYVVVAADAPYSTSVVVYPDGRVIHRNDAGHPPENLPWTEAVERYDRIVQVWADDNRFLVDRLTAPDSPFGAVIDRAKIGATGHSFGGAAAVQFCGDDPRCVAAIDIDGIPFGRVVEKGLHQPLLFLLSEHGNDPGDLQRNVRARIASVCAHDTAECGTLEIRGARHFNFSDQAVTRNYSLGRLAGLLGPIGAPRGIAVSTAVLNAFFDIQLNRRDSRILAEVRHHFPELH